MAKFARADGPTPGGGAYSEIYYLDSNSNLVDESVATWCRILEYTEDGEVLHETLGIVNR